MSSRDEMWRSPLIWGLGFLLSSWLAAGCGRTGSLEGPCDNGQCPCIFDSDCPENFICIDNACVDREDYLECIANGARPEECNGRDDDCDGRIDEGMVQRACERSADGQTCVGLAVCAAEAGFVCDAPVPSSELCDGLDNDCNGVIDDPFVDANGALTSVDNCGQCGVRCAELIPDALQTACVVGDQGPRCQVVTCPDGTFPNDDGTTCLGLPDALCRPCETDDDCIGPGSRCLLLDSDERACGRDCGPESPYGQACPAGYACADSQCRPTADTCLCSAASLGTTRSCRIDTCDGFETCESIGNGFDWGSCDISAWQETCDGLDNDCDGQIDNGFLNPVTQRYESDLHCGQCNNDCTRRWAPEVDHAIGGCDVSDGRPECRITACTTETVGGVDFEWVDVNGLPADGCECRRRAGNTATDEPDRGTFDQLSQGVVDENCDGIDGVVADALFVSETAPAGGDGSRARPMRRIQDAVDALPGSGRLYVLVAEGVYRERVVLLDGVQIYGGYSSDFRRRDVLQLATIVQSPIAPGAGPAGSLVAENVGRGAARTIVAGLHVFGPDAVGAAAQGQSGALSVGVQVRNSGPGLTLQNLVLRGGTGGAGGRGADGQTGFGRLSSTEVDGGLGRDGRRISGVCPARTLVPGGVSGRNSRCGGVDGRAGGAADCPQFNWLSNPVRGTQANFIAPTVGGDGAGGFHRSFDDLSRSSCSHVTESGFPSDFQTHNGADGVDGSDGARGSDGLGCRASFGTLAADGWRPGAGRSGTAGVSGGHGGGGGAGGGTARFTQTADFCNAHEVGATGGGGAAGGCGGTGGSAGGSGGASIALLVVNDGPFGSPVVRENRIERGPGGRGGDGGFGGPGGQGGRGGFGGRPGSWSGSTGGKGGDGGNGGGGGGGGGGCGGPSLGVLTFQATVEVTNNAFTVPDGVETGGPGGAGGNGAVSGQGIEGGSRNILALEACGPGGSCPVGTSCDANNLCVP